MVCYDKIILEFKDTDSLVDEYYGQVINYLKCSKFKLGLLINFGAKSLQYKRVIWNMNCEGTSNDKTDYSN